MVEQQETLAEHVARKHSRPLFSYLARRLGSAEDAKDLMQEVLECLLKVDRRQVRDPRAYAIRCAAAVLAAHYERRKVRVVSIDELGSGQMDNLCEHPIDAVELGEDLVKVLRRLPRGVQRDVYIKRLLHETPFIDLAKEMRISLQVAYNYYYSTNKKVLEMLSEQERKRHEQQDRFGLTR